MIGRLLIANRGEIACRVMRTAQRLGIHTIGVYSDADAGARHVRLADEAWRLGPAPALESYLAIERVLAAARASRADAIHPGYGFLSESAEFAAACAQAGILFVGPPAAAIAALGSKSAAKDRMGAAGVPVLPGYHGAAQSPAELEAAALALGFPLIVKPCGGGGGKGMQVVAHAAELPAALAAARRIAASAFGDPALLIERYLPASRHVEVQVLCDQHGNALHLHTRDCSVQRRHQKLIEEAPAPDIADAVRERLHQAGLAVARAVGYVNAGTVEFLYADGEFWFMEMNTRLQVEHGVTEQTLGIDLVEWQLRIAAGEPLPFVQDALVPRGHALEARICAEDPASDFAPSAGRLAYLRWPERLPGVRVDAGFDSGDWVSSHYDSLLGKLIGTGENRPAAIAALERGLAALRIAGVTSNAGWLAAALALPAFSRATPTTRFLTEQRESLAAPPAPPTALLAIAALAAVAADAGAPAGPVSPWDSRDAFRINLPAVQAVALRSGGATHALEVVRETAAWRVRTRAVEYVGTIARVDDRADRADRADHGEGGEGGDCDGGVVIDAVIDGVRRRLDLCRSGNRLSLWWGAERLDFDLVDPRHVDIRASVHGGDLVARLPGTVVSVAVAEGDRVAAGATLVVIEAMKMEHTMRAPRAGVVTRVHFARGDRVAEGAVLIELAEPADCADVPGAPAPGGDAPGADA